MGRRKIEIKFIADDRNRSVTFIKRKNGLFKKAHELSILTGAKVTVHVEDIKERHFDYKSIDANADHVQQFQSDDDDDDASELAHDHYEQVDVQHRGSAESLGSTSLSSSRRESANMKPGHRRTQSSIHLSPNPTTPNLYGHARKLSGQPYPPRSPNTAATPNLGHHKRPQSLDFSMTPAFMSNPPSAGGPQRKFSIPSTTLDYGQLTSPRQTQLPSQFQSPYLQQHQQQQQQTSQNMYYQQNNSQQSLQHSFNTSFESPQIPSPTQMPTRYNNIYTNQAQINQSQQHLPTYSSNLAPIGNRSHSNSISRPDQDPPGFDDYGQSHHEPYEYMEEDANDPDFDAMATQASTPGNYDFSTNNSMTNLNAIAQRKQGLGVGLGLNVQTPQTQFNHYQMPAQQIDAISQAHQAAQQQVQQRGFYGSSSGAQSTPNLAWNMNIPQPSPRR